MDGPQPRRESRAGRPPIIVPCRRDRRGRFQAAVEEVAEGTTHQPYHYPELRARTNEILRRLCKVPRSEPESRRPEDSDRHRREATVVAETAPMTRRKSRCSTRWPANLADRPQVTETVPPAAGRDEEAIVYVGRGGGGGGWGSLGGQVTMRRLARRLRSIRTGRSTQTAAAGYDWSRRGGSVSRLTPLSTAGGHREPPSLSHRADDATSAGKARRPRAKSLFRNRLDDRARRRCPAPAGGVGAILMISRRRHSPRTTSADSSCSCRGRGDDRDLSLTC